MNIHGLNLSIGIALANTETTEKQENEDLFERGGSGGTLLLI